MNTESFLWKSAYDRSNPEPARLNHQNETGTTTRFCLSEACHCTTKREKKAMLPSHPITFQKCQSMPRKVVALQIQLIMAALSTSCQSPAILILLERRHLAGAW
jgi:hypothetical protein